MRYFLGFLVTMGLIILLIILLFRGASHPRQAITAKSLESYATTDAEVVLTIDGRVVYNHEHQQIRISVGRSNVNFKHIEGYEGSVKKSESFPNNENAYAVFLNALQHEGFTLGDNTRQFRDERGYCPEGQRYIYEIVQGDKIIQRYWSSTCGNPKTFNGSSDTIIELFKAQVPNYSDLTASIEL